MCRLKSISTNCKASTKEHNSTQMHKNGILNKGNKNKYSESENSNINEKKKNNNNNNNTKSKFVP